VKKLLKTVVIGVLLIVIVLLVAAYFGINVIIKKGVETAGPKVTKTPVSLAGANLSIFSGKGELTGLVVGNPEGFDTPNAFSLGTVRVELDPKSLLTDTIVVKSIYVDAPEVTYEQTLKGSNILQIKKNVSPPAEGEEPEKPAEPEEPKAKKKIIIKDFLVKGGKIKFSAAMGGKTVNIPLPEIHLTNIGEKEGGLTAKELGPKLIDPVTDVITQAVQKAGELIKEGAEAIKKEGEKVIEGVKEEPGKVLEKGKETGKGLLEGAKDLLP
jgi:hypothetical protein